jgi:hypothetical protein
MMPKQGNCQTQMAFEMDDFADDVYFWSVQAIDQSGVASVFAAEQYFDIGNVTGAGSVINSQESMLFPNPAKNMVHIDFGSGLHAEVRILNINSQLIKTEMINGEVLNMDVSGLAPGLYIVELISEKTKEIKKLSIKR